MHMSLQPENMHIISLSLKQTRIRNSHSQQKNRTGCESAHFRCIPKLSHQQPHCSPVMMMINWISVYPLRSRRIEGVASVEKLTSLPLSSTVMGLCTTTVWLWDWDGACNRRSNYWRAENMIFLPGECEEKLTNQVSRWWWCRCCDPSISMNRNRDPCVAILHVKRYIIILTYILWHDSRPPYYLQYHSCEPLQAGMVTCYTHKKLIHTGEKNDIP